MYSSLEEQESIVENGENSGFPLFSPHPRLSKKAHFTKSLKTRD